MGGQYKPRLSRRAARRARQDCVSAGPCDISIHAQVDRPRRRFREGLGKKLNREARGPKGAGSESLSSKVRRLRPEDHRHQRAGEEISREEGRSRRGCGQEGSVPSAVTSGDTEGTDCCKADGPGGICASDEAEAGGKDTASRAEAGRASL